MYEPKLVLNFGGIALATLVYYFIGALWYTAIFGKIWAREMGIDYEQRPGKKVMFRALILTLIGCFLTSFVLTHAIQIWRPSVWQIPGVSDAPDYQYGLMAAFFTWIGYFVPLLLTGVAYENRSWKFFAINAGYHFVGLMSAGVILTLC